MFSKKRCIFGGVLVLFFFGMLLGGFGCSSKNVEVNKKDVIRFADSGWDSLSFNNELARFIIEKGYGYKTDIVPGSTSTTLAGVAMGDIDIRMENWTNTYGDEYFKPLEKGDFVEVSVCFDDNAQGFYVPTYIIKGDQKRGIKPMAPDLKTVRDLEKYWELFKDPEDKSKGRIIGGPSTWSTEQILPVKIKNYDLSTNYNYFRPGSDTALATAITSAYKKGEPIVAYYWEPTWLIGKYDMTLLKEPVYSDEKWENGYMCEFPKVKVTIIVNKNLQKIAPDVVEFLQNFRLNCSLINGALAYMQDKNVSADKAAIWFLENHEEVWTKWISDDRVKKVKAELN